MISLQLFRNAMDKVKIAMIMTDNQNESGASLFFVSFSAAITSRESFSSKSSEHSENEVGEAIKKMSIANEKKNGYNISS